MADNTEHTGSDIARLARFESEVLAADRDGLADNEYHDARRALLNYLADLGDVDPNGLSLPDMIDEATRFSNAKSVREAALAVARVAYRDALLPEPTAANKLHRLVVALFEKGLRDVAEKAGVLKASQTYEKYDLIRQLHPRVCADLEVLRSLANAGANHELLLAHRPDVLRLLSKEVVGAYLAPYDVKRLKGALTHVFNELQATMQLKDATFITRLDGLRDFVDQEINWCQQYQTFLTRDYYLPLLTVFQNSLTSIKQDAKDRFVCTIVTKRACPAAAEKRYPLHEVARVVRVAVPMRNEGPGIAGDVRVDFEVREDGVQYDPIALLGDVRPGDFLTTTNIMVERGISELNLSLTVSWNESGRVEPRRDTFAVRVAAQDPNIDWKRLRLAQPYTTDVAEGDEFVGRAAKVNSIASRFLKGRMSSCFITGQKRVGKTSLARAVQALLERTSPSFRILYIEYGGYSAMDPVRTIQNLGIELFEAMENERDMKSADAPDFSGTLAPLTKLADTLAKEKPDLKFVFVLDEFDEISPEMYRFGPLAEAFFSNLRTLSAKRNVAFLLVGGEKMPFVMSAQGDQLNKFTSEQLDYFNRTDEWFDYQELVRLPVKNQLSWDESAVASVFELTNGHPYYTKLVCAMAFQAAVNERDADLTSADVFASAKRLVATLDSNSFAHLWKDGISDADRQKAEVFELNRRRVLCACARALRSDRVLTVEGIVACTSGLKIGMGDVNVIVNDFMRRGIFVERPGGFCVAVPLFEMWLRDLGISKLMSDALSEEYETKEQHEEEQARVTSAEVAALTRRWEPYRGQAVADEAVRAWIEQVPSQREQRLLFKLLQSVRYVSRAELRQGLKTAHGFLTSFIPPHFSEKRSDRRRDILVTWVDGAGKSGNVLAGLYAEENRIAQRSVVSPEALASALTSVREEGSGISAIVIVDDFVGTGDSLSKNLIKFSEEHGDSMKKNSIHLLVSAFSATPKGEQTVRSALRRLVSIEADFRIADPAAAKVAAFSTDSTLWSSDEERGRAKELCQRLGAKIHKTNPLGYGDQGLLLVFPDACPNNSLPILHGSSSGPGGWRPLFERPKH